jgi:hypothetical protein
MKRSFSVLIIICLVLFCRGQDRPGSQITLALKKKDIIYQSVASDALFSLNGATQEFSAVINLFPIVPNPDIEDSLAEKEKPLQLTIKGRFPLRNVSFLTVNDNNKSYSMDCRCSLYDTVKNCRLNFNLIIRDDQPPVQDMSGAPFYQARLSFAMILVPGDYGLNKEPFDIIHPVMIMVNGAQINKMQ